jgi:L-cysteine desulfidase
MDNRDKKYTTYLTILQEELIPAMGCTEPIAIAYAAAMARKTLGELPERIEIEASDNILKNVKSAIVPNTGHLKGIEAAAVAGALVGNADKILEVISSVDDAGKKAITEYLKSNEVIVKPSKSDLIFNIVITVFNGNSEASVEISHFHTNIVRIEKNGKIIGNNLPCDEEVNVSQNANRALLSVSDIVDFAGSVKIAEVKEILQRQIDYNMAIAEEGLKNDWGANIGSILLKTYDPDDIKTRAKAMAAAGADARMSGCELPVVIVSGSGNQGLTASVPVIEYARSLKASPETLYRALVVSNLVTIHQKTGIGKLSAYCGAVSAGVGAGAGITWLHGGRFEDIAHTIVNALAIISGIICDGAKPSCAAKIASAVDAGILGFYMYQNGQQFYGGDGIIQKGVENTIKNIGRLGSIGMRETDKEIIKIMLNR